MARKRKDSKPLTCSINRAVWDMLDAYSADTGVPKTVVVEKALLAYISGTSGGVYEVRGATSEQTCDRVDLTEE